MRLQFQWKLMAFFILVLLFFLFVQGYLIYSLKKAFWFASLSSFFVAVLLGYILFKVASQPLRDLLNILKQMTTGSQFKKEGQVYSKDELSHLTRAISELEIHLRNKIDEISTEKEYLQTVLRGMSEGVLVVNDKGHIIMINDALRELFSLSMEVIDRTPLEFIRNAELEGAIQEAIRDGKNSSFELTLPSFSGKTFEVNVVGMLSSEKFHKTGEGMRGAIAVFHNISRLKELEKIRQDFVANVSHELRTPLTTIKGYAETLLEGALKEEVAFQFVQVIKRQSDRLAKIVEDLLTLSKIESKEFQLKMENLLLPELIEDVLNFIQEAAEKKKISISLELPAPLMVKADRNYLEQILINFIDNAIKYGREGGKIIISAIQITQSEIEVSVRDNGIGIPKEDLPRIFERFYRVDKGRSRELGGTGLGLSIIKHLIQAHSGRVWAESQLGEGSTFYFTLPCS